MSVIKTFISMLHSKLHICKVLYSSVVLSRDDEIFWYSKVYRMCMFEFENIIYYKFYFKFIANMHMHQIDLDLFNKSF